MTIKDVQLSYSESALFSTSVEHGTDKIVVTFKIDGHSYVMIPVTKEEALEMATILIAAIRESIDNDH